MRRVLIYILLLAIGLSGWTGAAWTEDSRAGTVVVRWDAGLDRLGQEAVAILPMIRRQVAERLGWATEGGADVVIVHDLARMREEARAKVPVWAVGVALSGEGRIVIRADLLAAGQGSSLESVLRHEWVHLAWGRRAGANRRLLPLWAEEGIAEDVGGGISVDAGAALDVAAAFGRLLPFSELRARFPQDARGADLAYKQSRSWVQYVSRAAGWESIRAVLDDVVAWSEDSPTPHDALFGQSVRARTGLSVGEWAAAWRQAVADEARPWFHLILRDFSGLLLMVLAVIGAGAFLILSRRRKREIERLPDGPDLFQRPEDPAGPSAGWGGE